MTKRTLRTTVAATLLAAAVPLVLVGCADPAAVADAAPSTVITEAPVETGATTPEPTPTETTTAVDPADYRWTAALEEQFAGQLGSNVDLEDGVVFDSPSGNLHCKIDPSERTDGGGAALLYGCSIDERDWEFASESEGDPCYGAQIACGRGIEATAGQGVWPLMNSGVWTPNEVVDTGLVLPYGSEISFEGVTCTSEEAGVTCIEDDSSHGFAIARDRNEIF
ncbi:hypothetical protein [Agromyces seonyuensis]|uniref:Secreted protein n=1 Tax=Agromyces seonyuensis TaxID=2662446 RepID=A0A6I4NTJ1_9MICO|nr:hypothetical protein [Agromyces seonyuensis]MWB97431.1 hypothetical protein [Agromyces seonyuensis]